MENGIFLNLGSQRRNWFLQVKEKIIRPKGYIQIYLLEGHVAQSVWIQARSHFTEVKKKTVHIVNITRIRVTRIF